MQANLRLLRSRPLRVWPTFQASLRLFLARPTMHLALGAAVLFSLLSVFCVIGLVTTPWFMCELFALQLEEATGQRVTRTRSWLSAGVFLLFAVLLVSGVAGLTLLGTSPDVNMRDAPQQLGLAWLMKSAGFYALLAGATAVLFILPFLYCPLILVERRVRFDDALLESARQVASALRAHIELSLCAHVLQVAPLVIAAFIALWLEPSVLPLLTLCVMPLLCVSLPVGQGMIACAYVARREAAEPAATPLQVPVASADAVRSTARYALGFMLLVALPLVALLLLSGSLLRPSRLQHGRAPQAELVALLDLQDGKPARLLLADTALEVTARTSGVSVVASDGGGVGELPLRDAGPVRQVKVVRKRDAFAIEIEQGLTPQLTWIDRAGVRLDDDLKARLFDRVPMWSFCVVLLSLCATAFLTTPVLDSLSAARRNHVLPEARRPSADLLSLTLQRSVARARAAIALLLPLSLLAVWIGLRSVGVL